MKIVCVAGPTATGKTRLGVSIAKEFRGEVVSCDSMQVYRGMDIGTAKATKNEMQGIPHHMLDVADPAEKYSVAAYVAQAASVIRDINFRDKLPVIVGGTGLYMDSLIRGTDFADYDRDEEMRAQLWKKAEAEGGEALLEELRQFDPDTAASLHPNNIKRIVRAIEAYNVTGIPISRHDEETRNVAPAFDAVRIILDFRFRDTLYEKINQRVDRMISDGLVEEVQKLLDNGLNEDSTALSAIGYKETAAYLRGECTLTEAADRIKQASRRYAKRQLTWFRRHKDARWIYVDDYEDFSVLENEVNEFVKKALGY